MHLKIISHFVKDYFQQRCKKNVSNVTVALGATRLADGFFGCRPQPWPEVCLFNGCGCSSCSVASEVSSGEEVWLVSRIPLSNKLILEFIPIFYDHQHLKHAKRVQRATNGLAPNQTAKTLWVQNIGYPISTSRHLWSRIRAWCIVSRGMSSTHPKTHDCHTH